MAAECAGWDTCRQLWRTETAARSSAWDQVWEVLDHELESPTEQHSNSSTILVDANMGNDCSTAETAQPKRKVLVPADREQKEEAEKAALAADLDKMRLKATVFLSMRCPVCCGSLGPRSAL